jgi:hypothetical protein
METWLELDGRQAGGIDVQLLWDPDTQALTVVVHDVKTDETVAIDVEADQALEVFRHPFAYAN